MYKIGLIVNPIAGMGGRVGLKGTDGREILQKAKNLGAIYLSPKRTCEALESFSVIQDNLKLITCPGDMGENEAVSCGFVPDIINGIKSKETTFADTRKAAHIIRDYGVDLLLFAGGDGTARDIYIAIGTTLPVIGIPTGVKIHSAVFASRPSKAGELSLLYLQKKIHKLREVEVMDIDEQAFRNGIVKARLFGYLKIPYERRCIQGGKLGSSPSEEIIQKAIAEDIIESMDNDFLYIIGPGTTTRSIMQSLGLSCTLLGVDAVYRKEVMGLDLGESDLLKLINKEKAKLIITPIGGQGYIFGRGNQQLSPQVIRKIKKENIIIIATYNKIVSLKGSPLLVDTGDLSLDRELNGYVQIVTNYHERTVYRIKF
ncbi:hypothetical protein ES705_36171 [subsurface metagenome]